MKPITENMLFYGDDLIILREHIPSESVDLIYLDPPFNSSRTYNVLFKDEHGTDSEARKARREKGNDLSLHNTGGDFLPAIACIFALPFHSQEYPQGSRKIRNQIDCEL